MVADFALAIARLLVSIQRIMPSIIAVVWYVWIVSTSAVRVPSSMYLVQSQLNGGIDVNGDKSPLFDCGGTVGGRRMLSGAATAKQGSDQKQSGTE